MKLYFTNESKIFFQHMALATFQALSMAGGFGIVVEDLKTGILWKV